MVTRDRRVVTRSTMRPGTTSGMTQKPPHDMMTNRELGKYVSSRWLRISRLIVIFIRAVEWLPLTSQVKILFRKVVKCFVWCIVYKQGNSVVEMSNLHYVWMSVYSWNGQPEGLGMQMSSMRSGKWFLLLKVKYINWIIIVLVYDTDMSVGWEKVHISNCIL